MSFDFQLDCLMRKSCKLKNDQTQTSLGQKQHCLTRNSWKSQTYSNGQTDALDFNRPSGNQWTTQSIGKYAGDENIDLLET